VKFVFKINSRFDGFTPRQLPVRIHDDSLELGWGNYIEAVELGDEVWVYFKGPHQFENGVYARGRVTSIDDRSRRVWLAIHEHSIDHPLVGEPLASQLAAVVAPHYRQVFLVPEALPVAPECTLASTATSCARRLCETCSVWSRLQVISPEDLAWPSRLPVDMSVFAPAYWVVAPRSVAHGRETDAVAATTEVFSRFKLGERALAFPLALGMRAALRSRAATSPVALVPIPLSPDKAARGELNRTAVLAENLRLLTGYPVRPVLSLADPISKRALDTTAARFELEYSQRLRVSGDVASLDAILLVDDVCTNGSTLACAYRALKAAGPSLVVGAVTAGQMTVKAAVATLSAITR
jgi:phosphoribosylpyrophosphate synthetase